MSNNIYFPLDIWCEILVRLPAESLIRFRAVSKGFQAVIDDPCFVRSHTNNQQKLLISSPKVIIHNYSSPYSASGVGHHHLAYSLDLEDLKRHQTTIAATPLHPDSPRHSPPYSHWSVATCHGLVLTQKPFTIWNALTNERLELPTSPDYPTEFTMYESSSWAFGLGYDSATDDYKAVVIPRKSRQTHVYSLKQDSWRRIVDCPPCGADDYSRGLFGPGVFACGALNWLEDWGFECADEIVALDLGTEKYSLLQLPRDLGTEKYTYYMSLRVLGDGCLALCDIGDHSHLDVWVMKDYGDVDSWNKLFSIDCEQRWRGYLNPVAFIMEEEKKLLVFLQDGYRGYFFLFDVENNSLKRLEINGSSIREDTFLFARQMFDGTIFRLHANCGVRKKAMKKRKIISCTSNVE